MVSGVRTTDPSRKAAIVTAKPLPLLLRLGAGAILTTVLTGALGACGGPKGSDAPTDASVEDFCGVIGDLSTLDPEKLVDDLVEVGTPDGIPGEAREGFEVMIDEATADEISDADQTKVNTFVAYVAETCGGLPADPE